MSKPLPEHEEIHINSFPIQRELDFNITYQQINPTNPVQNLYCSRKLNSKINPGHPAIPVTQRVERHFNH